MVTASGGDEQDQRPSRFLAELAGDDVEIERASAATRWLALPALVFLGSASDEERMLYEKLRPTEFQPAPRRLTEELWQKNVIHPREDKLVGAIFSSTLAALAATTAQPVTAFGLAPETRTEPCSGPPARTTKESVIARSRHHSSTSTACSAASPSA